MSKGKGLETVVPASDAGSNRWQSIALRRTAYYGLLITFMLFIHQDLFRSVMGGPVTDWFQRNSEAYLAMLIIPLYFDVFHEPIRDRTVAAGLLSGTGRLRAAEASFAARRRSVQRRRVLWYVGIVVVAAFVQSRFSDDIFGQAFVRWMERNTESLMAAVVVAFYFDFVREPSARPVVAGRCDLLAEGDDA